MSSESWWIVHCNPFSFPSVRVSDIFLCMVALLCMVASICCRIWEYLFHYCNWFYWLEVFPFPGGLSSVWCYIFVQLPQIVGFEILYASRELVDAVVFDFSSIVWFLCGWNRSNTFLELGSTFVMFLLFMPIHLYFVTCTATTKEWENKLVDQVVIEVALSFLWIWAVCVSRSISVYRYDWFVYTMMLVLYFVGKFWWLIRVCSELFGMNKVEPEVKYDEAPAAKEVKKAEMKRWSLLAVMHTFMYCCL